MIHQLLNRLAVILLQIRFFFASESLALRFFPFFSVCFPLWNGEKTENEQMYNECRTSVERRTNGDRTEVERRTNGDER